MFKHNKNASEKGFSIVELAIGMVIVGVLLAGALQSYYVWREEQKVGVTADRVNKVSFAIQAFIATNGYFPCPASLTAPRTTLAYGTATDCANPAQAPVGGLGAAGVGAGLSGRTVSVDLDDDPVTPDVVFTPRVRIGGIPFRSLNIPERLQFDAYGNRIVYAMTEFLGDPATTLKKGKGGIGVEDRNGDTVLGVADSANYIVVAPGENLVGGYNVDGLQAVACAGPSIDVGNCNIDSIFVVDQRGDVAGANYFDDVLTYNTPIDFPRWVKSDVNPNDIHTLEPNAVVGGDFVFGQRETLMALESPPGVRPYSNMVDPQARLWVRGTVRVDGDLQTNYLCNENNEDCFEPSIIAGAGIACASANDLMIGVSTEELARPTAASPPGTWVTDAICTNGFSGSCGAGRVMTGISSGNPTCVCIDTSLCSGTTTTTTTTSGIPSSSSTTTGITSTSSYSTTTSGVIVGP